MKNFKGGRVRKIYLLFKRSIQPQAYKSEIILKTFIIFGDVRAQGEGGIAQNLCHTYRLVFYQQSSKHR